VQSIAWVVREHRNWGPHHPEFLALDDVELKLEYLRIRAAAHLARHHTLPGDDPREAETEAFDDIVALAESGVVPDDELWETLFADAPDLATVATATVENIMLT
jgi:hypothetical protein